MPSPIPKNPRTRQRRNRASTATKLSLVAPDGKPPALPDEREWHTETKCWWTDVFKSPMAGEFLPADVHGLYRLAVLVDDYWLADSATARARLSQEIRLVQQGYGLTPIDRRRLQWEVEKLEGERTKRRGKPADGGDPRLRLAK